MRVLLVHPARDDTIDRLIRLPPLGLACVGGALRAAGHEVRIVDAAVLPRRENGLAALLTGWRPQVVGISASTAVLAPALAVAATVKERDPDVVTLLGGVHATLNPAEVVREGAVDIAVHGEGERTAVDFSAALDRREPLDRVPGIAYRDGESPG